MSFADEAKSMQNNGFATDMLTKPGTLPVKFPSFDKPTLFRAFACPSEDGNGVQPWRSGRGQNEFTAWIKMLPAVVRMCGTERPITFISKPSDLDMLGMSESPYQLLQRIVRTKAKSDPTWKRLISKPEGEKKGAPIPFADAMIALQGCLLFHNDKDYRQQPLNCMLVMPKTATSELLEELHKEGTNINSLNLEEVFLGGDIVSPERGQFLRIGKKGQVQASTQNISFGGGGGGTPHFSQEKSREFVSYEVKFEVSPPVPVEMMLKAWVPWEQLVLYMTVDQQVKELSTAFRPEIVAGVFRDSVFESNVPATIRDRYFTSGAAPGYSLPGQQAGAVVPALGVAQSPANSTTFSGAGGVNFGGMVRENASTQAPVTRAPATTMPMPDAAPPTPPLATAPAPAAAPSTPVPVDFASQASTATGAGGFNFGGMVREQSENPTNVATPPTVGGSMSRLQQAVQAAAQTGQTGQTG